jgi:hypothetical protein
LAKRGHHGRVPVGRGVEESDHGGAAAHAS